MAFDSLGGRCGHGMGYYDRYIAKVYSARDQAGLPPPILIGVALVEQIVDKVPMDDHDNYMDVVFTRNGIAYERISYSSALSSYLPSECSYESTLSASLKKKKSERM